MRAIHFHYLTGCLLCMSLLSFGCGPGSAASQDQVKLRWVTDASGKETIVEVTGLDAATIKRLEEMSTEKAGLQRLLSVYAGSRESASTPADPSSPSLPPMLGSYRVEAGTLRFAPQFPLVAGVAYRAVFRPAELPGSKNTSADPLTATFELPANSVEPSTVVSRIYPSAALLPENLLKFYIHFSAPMSRGRIYDHIHLADESGRRIELPFLEIGEELWDPELKRLTLFIDPGRIKRGVRPLEEIGPSLEAGKSYTLTIDREWRDAHGRPLKESYEKRFSVGPADRNPPDPSRWRIEPPQSGSLDPLIVAFPESMDHALSQRVIAVTDGTGAAVSGETSMGDEERRWIFTPGRVWSRGEYNLVVQTTIEDLSGNNPGKPFEVDLFEGVERRITASAIKLKFVIR